jgi:hypothetical protein
VLSLKEIEILAAVGCHYRSAVLGRPGGAHGILPHIAANATPGLLPKKGGFETEAIGARRDHRQRPTGLIGTRIATLTGKSNDE